MESKIGSGVQACVANLLKPLVRVLLRYGVPCGAFLDIAKQIYVDVAMESFSIPGRKPTISRASVITGLSRKEILRIRRLPPLSDSEVRDRYNRAVRVISGWARDKDFADTSGKPAALPFEGGEKSFSYLARKYSGDVPARAILDELVRVGSVHRLENGEIQLHSRAYIPGTGEEDKIAILGNEVADLIQTIDHNLQVPPEQSHFQLKVAYDNLPQESIRRIRTASSRRAMKLLELLDRELSRVDRDVNPSARGTGRVRAGLSIFYFEEALSVDNPEGGK